MQPKPSQATRWRRRQGLASITLVASFCLPVQVLAADPVRGQTRYATPPAPGLLACADCHSEDPAVNNFGNIFVGRNAPGLIQRAINSNTGGMVYFSAYYSEADLADIAAYLGNSPVQLSFPGVVVAAGGAAQRLTVHASSKIGLSGLAAHIEPGGEFRILAGGCGASVPARESCHFDVAFEPEAPGSYSARLLIAHDGTATPVQIRLDGQAVPRPTGIAVLRPQSVAFDAAGARRTVTVTNGAQDPLLLKSISARPAGFAVDGGSCTSGQVLAAGRSCSVAVGFEPRQAGVRDGELRVEHDGIGATAIATLTAPDSTPGQARIVADAAYLDFGTQPSGTASPTRTLSVANAGESELRWAQIITTSEAFRILASSCSPSQALGPGARCQLELVFQPSRSVPFSGGLVLAAANAGPALRIPLSGLGGAGGEQPAAAGPRVALAGQAGTGSRPWLDAAVLEFRDRTVGSVDETELRIVTLRNPGDAPVALSAVTVSGEQSDDFPLTSSCRLPGSLAPGAGCELRVRFAPRAAGQRRASLVIDDGGEAAAVVSLSGIGRTVPAASLTLSSLTLDFGLQARSSAPAPRSLWLANEGSAPVQITGLRIEGSFALSQAANCLRTLAPGQTCSVGVGFTPSVSGSAEGRLSIQASDTALVRTVSLAGRATELAPTLRWLGGDALRWTAPVAVGASDAQVLRLVNDGNAPAMPGFAIAGAASIEYSVEPGSSCLAASVAPGGECHWRVQFHPTAPGPRSARLVVTLDGLAQTEARLDGTGLAPAAGSPGVGPTTAAWAADPTGTRALQRLVIVNTGSGELVVQALGVLNTAFVASTAADSGCAMDGFVLLPGDRCNVELGWSGSAQASAGGGLQIVVQGADGSRVVPLAITEDPQLRSNVGAGGGVVGLETLLLLAVAVILLTWRPASTRP